MKKEIVNKGVFLIILLVLILPVISAAEVTTDDVVEGAENVGKVISAFFQGFLEPLYGGGSIATQFLLGVLLFLLIFSVIPYILGEDHMVLAFFVTLAVTILSIIAIPNGFFSAILAQYGIMGATLLSVLPFIIILFFSIRVQNTLVARVIWLFYTLYYFGVYIFLTIMAYNENGKWIWVGTEEPNTLPYVVAMIAGIILFFFIVKVQEIVFKGKLESLKNKGGNKIELATLGLNLWGKAAEEPSS